MGPPRRMHLMSSFLVKPTRKAHHRFRSIGGCGCSWLAPDFLCVLRSRGMGAVAWPPLEIRGVAPLHVRIGPMTVADAEVVEALRRGVLGRRPSEGGDARVGEG